MVYFSVNNQETTMKHFTFYLLFIGLLTTFGCSNSSESAHMTMAAPETDTPTDRSMPEPNSPEVTQRKLLKEGYVSFETDNMHATRKQILDSIEKHEGYVSSDQEHNSLGRISNTIIVRVPAMNFDRLLSDASNGIERFDNKTIEVKDVTEEFLDIEARLKTKKELEKRYLALLERANSVSELLEVEKQMEQLRSEIESIEGRLKYLQNKVSLSTLSMTFYKTVATETAFGYKFKNGFRNGWDNLMWFFVGLINIWPFVLMAIIFALGFGIRRKKANVRRESSSKNT